MNEELKTLKTDFIKHIEVALKDKINNVAVDEVIKSAFHDEFSYNNDADLNVTIKFLPGQIQSGIAQYPGELMVEVDSKYYQIIDEALREFAIDYNEDVLPLNEKQYREFYSLPNVLGTFQNNGLIDCTAISLSFTLISFNNVAGLNVEDGIKLSLDGNFETEGHYTAVKWLNYAFNYLSDTNSTGGIGAPQVKQIGETTGNNYTIIFVPKSDDPIHQTLVYQTITGFNPNKKYVLNIVDFNPSSENPSNSTTSIDCIVFSSSLTQASNGLPILQVTFARGDF